jgi:hypothetical protein
MKKYEKPSMTRRELFSEQKIANTCWGYHSPNKVSPTWWYDKNGHAAGFVSFYIGAGDACGDVRNLVQVTWYQNRAALNAGRGVSVKINQSVTTDAGVVVQPFNDTVEYLEAAGGNNGNPFKGESGLILANTGMS